MSEEDSVPKGKGFELLYEFELILEYDPLIDEVGLIHPSQFASLNKEAESSDFQSKDGILSSEIPRGNAPDNEDTNFWNRDHELEISTHVLLPLYKAAKDVFMDATRQYKRP